MVDIMYDLGEENTDLYPGTNNTNIRQPRFPGLYVGNLTWWTTDQDVINSINSVGVNDVQEVKFFENRNNGQSKGFCVVTFGSETSLPIVMEKLPKLELYGQNPVVTPYNRQNLNLFESQTKTRPQINSNNGPNSHAAGIMGISSISGVHAGTQGLPYSGLNTYNQAAGVGGPRNPSYHTNMMLQMRPPRQVLPGPMNNGPMIPGHVPMNRMRFMQPQAWNTQGTYNPGARMPQVSMDVSRRDDGPPRRDDRSYNPSARIPQVNLDLSRRGDESSFRRDEGSMRREESSSRRDDVSSRRDEGSSRRDEGSSRRDEGSSRRDEGSSRRDEGSSRRDEGSSRRDDRREKREEKSSRREDRSLQREEKSSRREKSHHRSDDRGRSRSRERDRSRERSSRERKDRRERRERY